MKNENHSATAKISPKTLLFLFITMGFQPSQKLWLMAPMAIIFDPFRVSIINKQLLLVHIEILYGEKIPDT